MSEQTQPEVTADVPADGPADVPAGGPAGVPASAGAASSGVSRSSGVTPTIVLAGVVLFAATVLCFWEFWQRQVRWAILFQADWGHTLAIPFISGYFVYLNRERLLARPFRTNWLGFVLVFGGMLWYWFCSFGPQVLGHHNLMSVGVFTTIAGYAVLFCGVRAMTWLWFPIVYWFVFGQTISNRFMGIVTWQMQGITAIGSEILMSVLQFNVERAGNTLTVIGGDGVEHPLNVAEACSGMRMLMAFLALGVAMAYTGFRRFWQRALMVIMGVPTAIFVNVLRVTTLGLLSMIDTDFAAGDFHTFIGLVWLIPAFIIYLGIMWVIRHLVVETSEDV